MNNDNTKHPCSTPTLYIASFDIGKKNFAFCIERCNLYVNPNTDTTTIIKSGTIVLLKNIDCTGGTDSSKYLDPRVFLNMNRVLDEYKSFWDKCSYILIEQQMSFGNKRNVMALKLAQHCHSYFLFHYANFKCVIDFPSYHKTQVLNAPKKMSKPQRKKWAIVKATEILQQRNDTTSLEIFQQHNKKDDLADVVLQLQSFKVLYIHNLLCINK